MVTVAEELDRALQLASGTSGLSTSSPPVTPSLCRPSDPHDTSGPPMSPDHIGPLQMSPAFSVNSSLSRSNSLVKEKDEAVEEEESRDHQEETGIGGKSSLMENKFCSVQLQRVAVVPNTGQVQMRPGHIEETRSKKIGGARGEIGAKEAEQHSTKSQSRVKVKCDECGKEMRPSHLSRHKKLVHMGEKPYECRVNGCSERFSRSEGLGDHGRTAHGHPMLKCKVEDCGLEFSAVRDLRSHHIRAHYLEVECTQCGKIVKKHTMLYHMKFVHRGERPVGCEISGCVKRYLNKTDLEDHMRAVHGSPKLECSVGHCTAEFVYRKRLIMHSKQHLS